VVVHEPLQLGAVGEGVAAVRAAVVVLAGLVAILNVFLQRSVAFVAPGAVWASVQLGEGVRCACGEESVRRSVMDDASICHLSSDSAAYKLQWCSHTFHVFM